MAGYSRPAVARIFGVPALGGLLFGWDIGATSYVLTQLQSAEYSGVSWSGAVAGSSFLQGLITSGGVAGALIGAMIVFRIADAIGRRRELILAALLYIAGGVLEVGRADAFRFARYQSLRAMSACFESVRSMNAFKPHEGDDGRLGHVCSTKLGGDWVLAESDQVAPSCTCEQVLAAYLDGALQKKWNDDKVASAKFSLKKDGRGKYYQQDLELLSQRVIRSKTGPMSYSQTIEIDRIGKHNYCAHVQLDPNLPASARKPFESLNVYVGLEQRGDDVHIYAAGIFEVNRRVVPNLLVFDASAIAGDMAGKGTLWLSGEFEKRRVAAAEAVGRASGSVWERARRAMDAARNP